MQQKIEQAVKVLEQAVREFGPVCFANSLGAEDMVLTDLIDRHELDIEIFSLDTGRLPQETYTLMQEVAVIYSTPLKVYFPDSASVERYVTQHGVNGFYESVESRKSCCFVRKVEPLRRALHGKGAWVTGLRRDQAVTRGSLEVSSYDADFGLQKFNPLLDWSNKDVWAYIRRHDVPYNKLHDQFYPSLGCAPCTRSITAGEDIRAGRWWWENPESKECGLHVSRRASEASAFGISVEGNAASEARGVSRNQNSTDIARNGQSPDALRVSAKGNVGSEAHDVSRSQNPQEGQPQVSNTSLQASRGRISEIAAHADVKQKVSA